MKTQPNARSGAPPARSQRVLVADDDEDFLELLTWLLEREGFCVQASSNGTDLLALVGDGSPSSLVITDLQMPGISGLAVLSYLKRHHPDVPAILMTAFASELVRAAARENGAAAVLAKPFGSIELSECVARHIRVH